MSPRPSVVAHADWGVAPGKRWCAVARRTASDRFEVHAPVLVGAEGPITDRMGAPLRPGETALLGFDFPIGVPERYASRAGITDFGASMLAFGRGEWASFYDVANTADEIDLRRPFYPGGAGRKGEHSRQVQRAALGLGADAMLRRCERGHAGRPAANPLFWTLGGAQVGKGALSGWREMLVPALADPSIDVALWPFEGSVNDLLATRDVVVVETYPAEFYTPIGVRFGARNAAGKSGKRQQHDRRLQAEALLRFGERIDVHLTPSVVAEIRDGFGSKADGEDRFDAVVGLLGMLAVVTGQRAEGVPDDDAAVRSVEGWILGRPPEGE